MATFDERYEQPQYGQRTQYDLRSSDKAAGQNFADRGKGTFSTGADRTRDTFSSTAHRAKEALTPGSGGRQAGTYLEPAGMPYESPAGADRYARSTPRSAASGPRAYSPRGAVPLPASPRSGAARLGLGGGAGRGGYPRLHALQWLWEGIAWYWGTVWWFVTLPWQALRALTPGFLRPAVAGAEDAALAVMGPPVRLAAWALHGALAFFDNLLTGGRYAVASTHTGNVAHFWVAYEAYLRLVQHKAHLVERHGWDGLWMALATKTV